MWLRGIVTAAAVMVVLAAPAQAGPPAPTGGWDYLINKLVADGVPRARVLAAFRDPRVADFDGLDFSLYPHESVRRYRGLRAPASVAAARRCRDAYDAELRAAEDRFGVPASVVAALLHVETHCGRNTGSHMVFTRVARLAMANDPANVNANLYRHTLGVPYAEIPRIEQRVRQRAREIEGTFYPEVLALFSFEERVGIDPLAIRGSGAGAFGLPQFLPSSYLRFAVDGNGDGRVSLYDPDDAAASAANYLARHGWRPGVGHTRKRQVIWAYNHSDPYVDTVLLLADRIEDTHPSPGSLAER
jgi:membrane-bound lytic murein transglycosylase B